jgi:hypothetical protein
MNSELFVSDVKSPDFPSFPIRMHDNERRVKEVWRADFCPPKKLAYAGDGARLNASNSFN